MKESLYIVYTQDDIGKQIQSWLTKTNQEFEVNKVNIPSTIKVKDDIIPHYGDEFNALVQLEFIESSINTEVIDMSHHNIRYGILIEKVRELLENENGKQQIKTQKNISCKTNVQLWNTWKEYNFRLKLNKGFEDDAGNWQQELTIPLLKIKERTYAHYLTIIQKHINHIRKHSKNVKLCPFELVILYYMNQIIQRHYTSKITMMELYNIVDVYEKAFKHHFKGHDLCCCKSTFIDNLNKNSFSDYLNSHYEQMSHVDCLVHKLIETYPNTDWNADHRLKYIDANLSSRFIIKSECPFIGYNQHTVILCYIHPQLTKLNVNQFKTRAIIDTFIVKYQNEYNNDNYAKYYKKQIVVCIIATNLIEPYYLTIEVDELQVKEIISKSMYDHYVFRNKEMYNLYKTYRKKYEPKDFIRNCITNWIEFKENTNSKVPLYIDGFMDDLNRQFRKCKDIHVFLQDLDETFLDKLNEELKYSIRDFLKL
jgi:hypothetical protein